jgi:hypothetical protein
MMPPQLARSKRRHNRHSERRKLVELTPHISIHDLLRWKAFPQSYDKSYLLEAPFKYPFVKCLVVSCETIEIHHHSGYIQPVLLRWIRTGFGRHRPLLTCRCGRSSRRLFFRHGSLACRHCHGLQYASRQLDSIGRKRLQASKLRLSIGGQPNLTESPPPKPKWQHHRTYYKARKQLDSLEAPIKTYRFKKPLSAQLLAYHIA